MLHELAGFVEAKDVDTGPVSVQVGRPDLVTVDNHEIPLSDRSEETDPFAWVLSSHALKVLDERGLSVSDVWVVLGVGCTQVELNCLPRLALIEHQIVERDGVLAVLIRGGGHGLECMANGRGASTLTLSSESGCTLWHISSSSNSSARPIAGGNTRPHSR